MHLPCLSYLLYTSALFGPFIRRLPNHHIPATLPTDVIDCSPLSHSVTPYPRLVPLYLFTAHCALRGPQAPLPPPAPVLLVGCPDGNRSRLFRARGSPHPNIHPSIRIHIPRRRLALQPCSESIHSPRWFSPPPTASFRSVSFPFRVRPQCTASRARPSHLRPGRGCRSLN